MEQTLKINYAPDTVFVTGRDGDIKILNSKGTGKNKCQDGTATKAMTHCKKCNLAIASKLN